MVFFQFPCFFNEAIFSDLDHDQQQLYDSCQSKADQNKARTLKDCILSARERVDRFSLSDPKQKCLISLNVVNWCLIQQGEAEVYHIPAIGARELKSNGYHIMTIWLGFVSGIEKKKEKKKKAFTKLERDLQLRIDFSDSAYFAAKPKNSSLSSFESKLANSFLLGKLPVCECHFF